MRLYSADDRTVIFSQGLGQPVRERVMASLADLIQVNGFVLTLRWNTQSSCSKKRTSIILRVSGSERPCGNSQKVGSAPSCTDIVWLAQSSGKARTACVIDTRLTFDRQIGCMRERFVNGRFCEPHPESGRQRQAAEDHCIECLGQLKQC